MTYLRNKPCKVTHIMHRIVPQLHISFIFLLPDRLSCKALSRLPALSPAQNLTFDLIL